MKHLFVSFSPVLIMGLVVALSLLLANPTAALAEDPACVWNREYKTAPTACFAYCPTPHLTCCEHEHLEIAWYQCSTTGNKEAFHWTKKYFTANIYGCNARCPYDHSETCTHFVNECELADC